MIRLTAVVTIAALIAGAAYAAQEPSAPSEPSASPVSAAGADGGDSDPMKVICRRVRPPTGTRIAGAQTRQQMCMTKADWEQQELDAQEALKFRDEGICSGSECSG